jgi:hypothetical protein
MAGGFRLSAIIITIILALAPGTRAEAFHSGSPHECKECHTGKNAAGREFDQSPPRQMQGPQKPPLGKSTDLTGSDESSTCLRCHQAPRGTRQPVGYYVATGDADMFAGMPPAQLTPGGDFGWLKKNYTWTASGSKTDHSPGERHGHNIVALDFGYEADGTYPTVPKGIYPARALSCISCHDPHGTIGGGSYRMLGGAGYEPGSAGGVAFTVNPPAAVAPRVYNRSEAVTDTRTAYGKGMSEWCANCHTGGCSGAYGHPTCSGAKCDREVFSNYNAYVKSGDINGRGNASYTSLVPFEEGTNDTSTIAQHAKNDGSYLKGPDSRANVMCLTCHRAHASGWDHMARWNMATTFIVHRGAYPGINNGSPAEYAQGRTAAETQKAYYDRPSTRFAAFQKSLCNKCHVRD